MTPHLAAHIHALYLIAHFGLIVGCTGMIVAGVVARSTPSFRAAPAISAEDDE